MTSYRRLFEQTGSHRSNSLRQLTIMFCGLALIFSTRARAQFKFSETTPATLELSEAGKPVFVYNFGGVLASGFPETMRRSGYIHPVYAPDGTLLTDDFNKNHPHHRGIFWAWEEITYKGKKDDLWTVKGYRSRFVRWIKRKADAKRATLAIENGWYDGNEKFVKETVEVVTHPVEGNRRTMEFTLHFEAIKEPVKLEGVHTANKGYGGFAMRFQTPDEGGVKTIIRTDKGLSPRDGVMARHPWAQISGVYKGKSVGARIEDDPSNPGYPMNGWLMRHELCILNCSYPGNGELMLEPGKPLVLKYKVTLFAGEDLPAL